MTAAQHFNRSLWLYKWSGLIVTIREIRTIAERYGRTEGRLVNNQLTVEWDDGSIAQLDLDLNP